MMEQCFNHMLSGKFESSCLQLLLSKSLGFLIIFFSFTFKVPQIKNMINSKTDRGLSYLSAYLEIIIFLFGALYGFHNKNPISTYGENIIILLQTVVILSLSWTYAEKKANSYLPRVAFILGMTVFSGLCIFTDLIPEQVWVLIGSSSIPMVSVARLSQIYVSFKTKDTGPLSAFTFALGLFGGIARVFTTYTETKDVVLMLAFSYSSLLNLIILIQIFMYGNKSAKVKVAKTE